MGIASAGFFCNTMERTRYLPKLFNAARCSQMLVGASFCLIFRSQTKALMFISEKASSGNAPCFAFGSGDLFSASDVIYFSSDFR